MRWCWVNFQCRCVLLIWIRVGQGPTALAVGAGGLDIFSLICPLSERPPDIDCLKGPLNPKQPTNQHKTKTKYIFVLKPVTRYLNVTFMFLFSPQVTRR